jgi:hypothetical protein
MRKLWADQSQGMLAIIHCRIFCLPVYYPKMYRLTYTKLQFCLLFCMVVKLACSSWGRNVGWKCSRIGCWGGYRSADYSSFLVHAWWCSTTFSSPSLGILEHVSRTMDQIRYTSNMACSFSWFKSLGYYLRDTESLLFMLQASVSSRSCNNKYKIGLKQFLQHLEYSSKSCNHCSVLQCFALKLKGNTFSIFIRLQVAVNM